MDPLPNTIAHLSPLILDITKLSWDNLVDTHSRWAEEVSSICTLAGSGVYASLQIPHHTSHHTTPDVAGPNSPSAKRRDEENKKHMKQEVKRVHHFTEHDDHVARSIIILCMARDIRDRFAKLMKVATTSKKLFNGIAILKEAVSDFVLKVFLSESNRR